MKKFLVTYFVLLTLFFVGSLALNAENYIAYIEERSRDEKFVEEYTKWSSKLLSQPGYLYGASHSKFPCLSNESDEDNTISTSVHTLRPSDIKCIGAMGDSLTTGLGARGLTPLDLLFEDRGISWSAGGDYTYSQIPTIPNALRQYNSILNGFSTKGSILGTHEKHLTTNRLNVARSGARSSDMSSQADLLIGLLRNKSLCNLEKDWKMITIFVGANDLCRFCEETDDTNYTPERYMTNIRLALDKLYHAMIPRMLINLVLPPDIRGLREYDTDTYICQTLLQKICPCAASPTAEQAGILDDYVPRYQELLRNLTSSGQYEKRDDFTVIIQPFMSKTPLPYKHNQTIDFSYLSPDCFHFSGKGHSQAAISLWNNMFEPVGMKQDTWNINESLKCPTQAHPYIFTSKNSPNALNKLQSNTTDQPRPTINDNNATSLINTTKNSTSVASSNVMFSVNTTGDYTYVVRNSTARFPMNDSDSTFISDMDATTSHGRKHRKHRKSKSDASMSKMKVIAIVGFTLLIVSILIVGIIRRKKRITFIATSGDGKFNRLSEESEDDLDLYTQPTQKSQYSDEKITKTHGTRIPLD